MIWGRFWVDVGSIWDLFEVGLGSIWGRKAIVRKGGPASWHGLSKPNHSIGLAYTFPDNTAFDLGSVLGRFLVDV